MTTRRRPPRKGNVLLLTALMMIGMLAFLALTLDMGVLYVSRSQAQRSADAAAIAACWELIDDNAVFGFGDSTQLEQSARTTAGQYASLNGVLRESPSLSRDDIVVGYLSNPSDPDLPLITGGAMPPNAVRVVVRRTSDQNGEIPLFFGRALGRDGAAVQAEATAALLNNISGFRAPSSGENVGILPFALDLETWENMLVGIGSDNWRWNPDTDQVEAGPDGILELNLFPQGTGSPGNRGTVDIGSRNNSTADIARQVLFGVTPGDLAYHGGELKFDENGELELNADTGISAAVKNELRTVIGQPRIIPVFEEVELNGDNAIYTIVQWVGVRVLDVKLTGQMTNKRVIIQPANIIAKGGIPSDDEGTSSYVYSPVWLVR